jgi:hypothetical protein
MRYARATQTITTTIELPIDESPDGEPAVVPKAPSVGGWPIITMAAALIGGVAYGPTIAQAIRTRLKNSSGGKSPKVV